MFYAVMAREGLGSERGVGKGEERYDAAGSLTRERHVE
jgi:hypothetical protein